MQLDSGLNSGIHRRAAVNLQCQADEKHEQIPVWWGDYLRYETALTSVLGAAFLSVDMMKKSCEFNGRETLHISSLHLWFYNFIWRSFEFTQCL